MAFFQHLGVLSVILKAQLNTIFKLAWVSALHGLHKMSPFFLQAGWSQVPINCFTCRNWMFSLHSRKTKSIFWNVILCAAIRDHARLWEGITTFWKDELLLHQKPLHFDFSFYLCWGFLFAARCINHTGKDIPSLLKPRVIDQCGHYFSFKEGKDMNSSLFYRIVTFDIEDGDWKSRMFKRLIQDLISS